MRGIRNWDYRYTWIRDAASGGPLQIMYGIDGRTRLPEEALDHLEGCRESSPVRVGNGAYDQLQLGIYGGAHRRHLPARHGVPVSYDMWQSVRTFVDWVCEHWHRTDEGVWEVRGGQQQFVYSKLMCWVAVDRELRLARKRSLPVDEARWQRCRDEIYETIMSQGTKSSASPSSTWSTPSTKSSTSDLSPRPQL